MDLIDILAICNEQQASDLHLTVNEPPLLRIDGNLCRLNGPPLREEDLKTLIYGVLTDIQQVAFERDLELDFALSVPGVGRFRVNVHRQRGAVEAALRRIPTDIPDMAMLGLPPVIAEFARMPNGLVLITGATGMGKSTTLAAMVGLINEEREVLITCMEDPIEILYTNHKSIIKQREVFSDTLSFSNALRHALRQDPDVLVVGEMRDLETISTTLTAAETGHLVLATLHTSDVQQSISRIIDVFPANQQAQIQMQLADCLNGIVCQILLPHISGKGRVLATEILVANPAIRNLIRSHEIEQIPSLLQTNNRVGMHTMDASLAELYARKQISFETAKSKANDVGFIANATSML